MPFHWDDDYGARLGCCAATTRSAGALVQIDLLRVPRRQRHDGAGWEIDCVAGGPVPAELWRDNGGFRASGALWDWTIDLADGTVRERQLDDLAVEFPRIDDRLAGSRARYSVSVGDASLVRR